ncbi:MAG: hypothetical protein V4608_02760 [Bacteroidota bacterium]
MEKRIKKVALLLDNEFIRFELENNIIIGTFKVDTIDLNLAQKLVEYRISVISGESYPTIANIASVKNVSKPARDFFASEKGCEGITATALLIDSPLGRMIGNFYISINKPLRPVKIFTNQEKAKLWLVKYKYVN